MSKITSAETIQQFFNGSAYPANEFLTNASQAAAHWITVAATGINEDANRNDTALIDNIDYAPCNPENPQFNCTAEQYMEFTLGPQTLPLYKALLVSIIFGGIFVTGVLGNVLVCIVIIRHSAMHTATNYYLFSLAVSDLLYLLFGLPTEVFLYWHQYPYLFGLPFCKIRAFISEASTYVSVFTIVAFSMERFLAICHPLHLYAMVGFKRALRIITVLWIASFISAIPFGVMTDIQYLHYPPDDSRLWESAFCSMTPYTTFPLFEISFCIFFVIPMILIILLYWRMAAQIKSRTTKQLGVQHGSMHRESKHSQAKKAVILMLAAVVVTFFVCWFPFHLQRLWFLYAQQYENYNDVNEWLFSLAGFAYYVSCTINPIVYNVMSHRYRVAFKDILCGRRRNTYLNNGYAREHSSFRETASMGANSHFDRVHSVYARPYRNIHNTTDRRDSMKSFNVPVKKTYSLPSQKNTSQEENPLICTNNMVVMLDNEASGHLKTCVENEIPKRLLDKNCETSI